MHPTPKQLGGILSLIGESQVSEDTLQALRSRGILTRVLKADPSKVNLELLEAALAGAQLPIVGKPTKPPRLPKLLATPVELGTLPDVVIAGAWKYTVRYNQMLTQKLAQPRLHPITIGSILTNIADDQHFVSERRGTAEVVGRVVGFRKGISNADLDAWAERNNKRFAEAKEHVDFCFAVPQTALNENIPIAARGNFWPYRDDRCFLCVNLDGGGRCLNDVWSRPTGGWRGNWWFLALDK